jgi:hypothetical protein
MVNLLIVGLATDGPTGEVFQVETERELLQGWGGLYTQRFTYSGSGSAINLTYEPFSLPKNTVNGVADQLFAPYFENNTYYFGTMGSTGAVIDISYVPYLGKSDLLYAARKHFEQVGRWPGICRFGGTKATLSVGGYSFSSIHPGLKYNNVTITWDSSAFVVSGLEPHFPTLTYPASDTLLQKQIYKDVAAGICPVYCTQLGSSFPVISRTLSGGTDGSFSDQTQITSWFDQLDIPYNYTHVLFLGPLCSGLVNGITEFNTRERSMPRVWFAPAPDFESPIEQYLTDLYQDVPYRNNMLVTVLGDVKNQLQTRTTTRYSCEAMAIAFIRYDGYNITNLKLDALDFSPVFSNTNLALLKSQGLTTLMRYIDNDISLYQGVTTLGERPFLYSSKVVEVWSVALDVCYPYLGKYLKSGRQISIEDALFTRLQNVSHLKVTRVRITVLPSVFEKLPNKPGNNQILMGGDVMEVYIEGDLPDEILTISFTISN